MRTYNYPENRISDHRVGYKSHDLDRVLDGDLDAVLDALRSADRAERMARPDGGRAALLSSVDTVDRAAARLAEAGVASPRVDAELLVAHVLGVPRGRLLLADPPDDGAARGARGPRRAPRRP